MSTKSLVLAALIGVCNTAAIASAVDVHTRTTANGLPIAASTPDGPGIGNGLTPNGLHLNGANLNGLQLNGASVNGLHLNGLHLNGLHDNGLHVNGLGINGLGLNGVGVEAPGLNTLVVRGPSNDDSTDLGVVVDGSADTLGVLRLLASAALAR